MNPNWQALADKFCPRVYLCTEEVHGNKEQFLPSSIEWYLEQCILKDTNGDKTLTNSPTLAKLGEYKQKTAFLTPKNHPKHKNDNMTYRGDLSTAKMYVHFRSTLDASLDIQYWFFYPYNGDLDIRLFGDYQNLGNINIPLINVPNGSHEGDWEHITVRVSNWQGDVNQASISGVYYAAHGSSEGDWKIPGTNQFDTHQETHPIVYSAWHSHASYSDTKDNGVKLRTDIDNNLYQDIRNIPLLKEAGLVDFVSSEGKPWGPLDKRGNSVAEIICVDPDLYQNSENPQLDAAWLEFTGLWGNDGPRTPPSQSYWRADPPMLTLVNGFHQNGYKPEKPSSKVDLNQVKGIAKIGAVCGGKISLVVSYLMADGTEKQVNYGDQSTPDNMFSFKKENGELVEWITEAEVHGWKGSSHPGLTHFTFKTNSGEVISFKGDNDKGSDNSKQTFNNLGHVIALKAITDKGSSRTTSVDFLARPTTT